MWFFVLSPPFHRALCLAQEFWRLLLSTLTWAQTLNGPGTVQQREYKNLDVHPAGQYHLWREGTFQCRRGEAPSTTAPRPCKSCLASFFQISIFSCRVVSL